MALTNPNHHRPPRHLPQSESQRQELLRRIDAAELAELRSERARAEIKAHITRTSEGVRTVQVINEGLRTGAIRLQPEPTAATSLTADKLLLRADGGKPVLRVVQGSGDPVQGNASPRWVGIDLASKSGQTMYWAPPPHPHKPPALTPYERRAVLGIVVVYLLAFAGLTAITIWGRAA